MTSQCCVGLLRPVTSMVIFARNSAILLKPESVALSSHFVFPFWLSASCCKRCHLHEGFLECAGFYRLPSSACIHLNVARALQSVLCLEPVKNWICTIPDFVIVHACCRLELKSPVNTWHTELAAEVHW